MTKEFLSQSDVDSLLSGLSGEVPFEGKDSTDATGVRPYDLATQERIVRGRMPTLEIINERFARLLRGGIFNFMRKTVEISSRPIKVIKYAEFVRNLVVPTNLNLVHIRPLRGTALIILDPNLVFMIVDHLFGGNGKFHTRVEGRDFTSTEMKVINRILDVTFTEYEKSWKSIYEIKCEYIRSEVNTQFANICNPSEVVVSTSFDIELPTGTGALHICIPYSSIEPIRDTLYSAMQGESVEFDHRWVKLLSSQMQDAKVELSATLAETEITLGEILNFEAGDIIPLDLEKHVFGSVDQVPVFDCRYGVSDGHYALRIENVRTPASRAWENLKSSLDND